MGMTNAQLYLAIGLPVLAVITSLVVSLVQISAIREDSRSNISSIREDNRSNMAEIRTDIRGIRDDIKLLTGKVYELMAQQK